jgi:hypothetical protein
MSEQTVKQEGEFKLKKRKTPKKLSTPENNVTKVSMKEPLIETEPEVTKVVIKQEDNAIHTQETNDSNVIVQEQENSSNSEGVVEEVRTTEEELDSPIQLVDSTEEQVSQTVAEYKEAVRDEKVLGKPLPENIEKLVTFMEETGGDINDYVRLNADYSTVDNNTLIREYYKQTKPYLEGEDIDLMLEDFSYDEDIDEQRDIRKKKLAFKEEVAKARNFLEETKSKYYDEIKLRPGVTQDQQKATDFFNRYNEEQKAGKAKHSEFLKRTNELLTDDFKGFDFNVGESKFRYSVKNPQKVAEAQSDISNFIGTFLNDKGEVKDTKGYHKALYAARNADTIAQHFYEQGKADAVRDVMVKSKNISTEPRKTSGGDVFINGLKVRAISGADSSKLKVKTRKFN